MKENTKSFIVIALLFLLVPSITFASWWNPFTWKIFNRVSEVKVEKIVITPPSGAEKLTDVDAYKIRAGDYRIIYAVKDESLIVLIVKVGNRRDVYKDISTIRKRLKK